MAFRQKTQRLPIWLPEMVHRRFHGEVARKKLCWQTAKATKFHCHCKQIFRTYPPMENPPWMKMSLLLKMGIFQCHVSFRGCIPNYTHLPIIIPHFFPHNLRRQNSCKTPPADHFRCKKRHGSNYSLCTIRPHAPRKKKTYSWWTKSCTSRYSKYPIICRVLYIPGGAGFLPPTVPLMHLRNCICTSNAILNHQILYLSPLQMHEHTAYIFIPRIV